MIEVGLIQKELFDPIVPFIRAIDGTRQITVVMPDGLALDVDVINAYFEDAQIMYEVGVKNKFVGRVKDPLLFNYLTSKFFETTPNFEYD